MIKKWILDIITIKILAVIIENITISTSMKKYVDLVVGLIMIVVVIRPFMNIAGLEESSRNMLKKYELATDYNFENKLSENKDIYEEMMLLNFEKSMNDKIKNELELVLDNYKVIDINIESKDLKLTCVDINLEDNKEINKDENRIEDTYVKSSLEKRIATILDIDREKIKIHIG